MLMQPQETIAAIISVYVSCTNMIIMLELIMSHKYTYKSVIF